MCSDLNSFSIGTNDHLSDASSETRAVTSSSRKQHNVVGRNVPCLYKHSSHKTMNTVLLLRICKPSIRLSLDFVNTEWSQYECPNPIS